MTLKMAVQVNKLLQNSRASCSRKVGYLTEKRDSFENIGEVVAIILAIPTSNAATERMLLFMNTEWTMTFINRL